MDFTHSFVFMIIFLKFLQVRKVKPLNTFKNSDVYIAIYSKKNESDIYYSHTEDEEMHGKELSHIPLDIR